jgi:hypothetical protein
VNVAQTSKSAVSQVSKPARRANVQDAWNYLTLPIWKSAIQQVWKPALRRVVEIMPLLWFMLFAPALFAQQSAADSAGQDRVRFRVVDILIDTTNAPLAAYQLEFAVTNGVAKIVGIEGGEHPAFREAPFYDPKAMQRERVIIAAFSTTSPDRLPSGKTRVATIHLQISTDATPQFEIKLTTAADSNGNKISARATVEERKPQ